LAKSNSKQHTIGREVWCEGVGLHSGANVALKLYPAPPNFGIRFKRYDTPGQPPIVAHPWRVVDTVLATSIGVNGVVVATIEHLMAALMGCGVDNVLVEVGGSEIPIVDGSAAPYVDLLTEAGRRAQNASRPCIRVTRPFVVKEGDAYIKALPAQRMELHYVIDFPHPLVGRQEMSWTFDPASFRRDIAQARTFGFLKDVQRLQRMGLALGGSLSNAVVFDEEGVLNREGFRFSDECVRHKILDFLGDLALGGVGLVGRFEAYKAGHSLHNRFIKELITREAAARETIPAMLAPPFMGPASIPGLMDPFPGLGKPL